MAEINHCELVFVQSNRGRRLLDGRSRLKTPKWYARLKQSSGSAPWVLTASSPELGRGSTPAHGFRQEGALEKAELERKHLIILENTLLSK
jgi:hypothetical protein